MSTIRGILLFFFALGLAMILLPRNGWALVDDWAPDVNLRYAPEPSKLLSMLHATNQFEIQVGQLAQSNGKSDEVKDLGSRLTRDHQKADKQIFEFAQDHNIDLANDNLSLDDRVNLLELQSLKGDKFDKSFLSAVKKDHDEYIRKVQMARDETSDIQYKDLLGSILPDLKRQDTLAASLEKEYRNKN